MKRLSLDVDYIVQEYRAGKTSEDLAAQLGVSQNTILRRLNRAGVRMRPSGTPRVTVDETEALRLYHSGIGLKGVAARMGVSDTAILRIFRARGVKLRNRSEQQQARMDRASAGERARLTRAAHIAARGRTKTWDEMCLAAQTREQNQSRISKRERALVEMLRERGVEPKQQTAVGAYNCDITVHPVAVEVFGGHWHWYGDHLARTEERFRYIMGQGWHIIAVPLNASWPLTPEVADHLVAIVEATRRDPPPVREYRVVWGAGEFEVRGRADDDHFTIEPPFTNARDPTTGQYIRVPRDATEM